MKIITILKNRLNWFYTDVLLILGIYKMCKCGDIYPKKQMFGELCWICNHNKEDTISLNQIEEQGQKRLKRSEEREYKFGRKENEEGL